LRLRWLWQRWKSPQKPWTHLDLPCKKHDRALLNAATKIILGDGKTARFWSDRWLADQVPAEIAPDIFKISARKKRTVRDALVDNKWIIDLKAKLDVQHEPQLTMLAELIDRVQLTDTSDDIFWRFAKRDEYAASSAYMMNFMGAIKTDFKSLVWKGWAPAKCKLFIWTLLLDSVLTADKLLLR
jgi:hypothetical protein